MLTMEGDISSDYFTSNESLTTEYVKKRSPGNRLDMYGDKHWELEIMYYIVCFLGIPGNIVTIIVLLSSPKLRRKPVNLFLVHQSFIDLAACCLTIVEEVLAHVHNVNGPVLCHLLLNKMSSVIMMYTSSYNMTGLTIERHFAIVNPLTYNPDKIIRILPFIFIAEWLFCIAVLVPFVPATTAVIGDECIIAHYMRGNWMWTFYGGYAFVIAIGLPMTVMTICYTRMIIALHQSAKHVHGKGSNSMADSKSNSVHKLRLAQINIFQTCLIMILFFLICWLTKDTALLLYIMGVYKSISNSHYAVGHLFIVCNSCLNPYIYAIRYDDFKQQMKRLWNGKRGDAAEKMSVYKIKTNNA